MAKTRIGIWLIGAKGGVGSSVILGLMALTRGVIRSSGLVSELPRFEGLGLPQLGDFVVGGHEIRDISLIEQVAGVAAETRAIDPRFVEECREELSQTEQRILPGTVLAAGPTIEAMADDHVPRDKTPSDVIARIKADLAEFQTIEALDHVIVVNVASTEPLAEVDRLPPTWGALEPLLGRPGECPLPASSLYAIAALGLGFSYINFTPSLGSAPAAIDELARMRDTRHMGCDGKTGETLMKSVLAPMFAQRNLNVMSWVGHNIFGNLDGKVLDNPENKEAKVVSKDRLLGEILGYRPQSHVSIEYVESLGDWKTAWDHIHFTGFLGTPMTLQFIWQGCDSALAAPLVIDLVRFTELARQRGQTGTLTFLASFFKSPYGVKEHGFDRQFQMLEDWVNQ